MIILIKIAVSFLLLFIYFFFPKYGVFISIQLWYFEKINGVFWWNMGLLGASLLSKPLSMLKYTINTAPYDNKWQYMMLLDMFDKIQ